MASWWDLKGTTLSSFKLGKSGPNLNASGNSIYVNNTDKILTPAELGTYLHPGYISGRYYPSSPWSDGLSSGTNAATANTISYYLVFIARPLTFSTIYLNQSATLTANFRFGIYSNLNALPSNLLVQVGDIVSATAGQKGGALFNSTNNSISNYTLDTGIYWLAINSNASLSLSSETSFFSMYYFLGNSTFATTPQYGYRNPYTYSLGNSLPLSAPIDSLTASGATHAIVWFQSV